MAQADGVVANGTGSAVRTDINNQYAALWSNHSGSTEPSSGKVAYQTWADTNSGYLKIRNAANNAWIQLFKLDGTDICRLTGSTNNTITTVTGANAIQGEANLTFDGTQLNTLSTLFGAGAVSKTQDGVIIQRNSSSGNAEIVAGRSGGNYSAIETYVAGASGVTKRYDNLHSGEHRWFHEDGTTERLRIDSSGRVLLGTTTEGNESADEFTVSNSGNTGITIRSTDSSNCSLFFSDATSGASEYAGYVQYLHSSNDLLFGTNAGERLRILSGGGIAFNGDTAAANALDSYEEGSWTPTVHDGTCGSSNARYVKIGRQVTIWAYLNNFSDRTTNDEVKIGGIPFNSESNGVKGSCMYRFCDESARTTIYFNSTNQMFLYGGETGNYTQVRHNELNDSNFEIYLMATYDAD